MEKSMNIMRKLWVGGASGGGGNNSGGFGSGPMAGGGTNGSQSISLGLMHLRKLFGEYMHSPTDDKIYNMLPLFCKVFGAAAASEMIERFPEINSFSQAVSKLIVSEVRRRAANQSTEAAAVSIIKFLEAAHEAEEDSRGWTLLSTLNLLSAGEQNLVEVMTAASVPSTLVKCLYLFFDLPEIQPPETKGPTSDFSPMERRLLLQKIFVQLLIRLSSYPAPAEELAKKDDLALLFSAVTSWCPPHNAMWRKSAAEVLMTISTHGLTPPVLSYIHNKGCISLCVENLRRGSHLTPLEVTEMVLTLFCFLKDSADLSQLLLDDFKSAQGYLFLTEILIRLESDLTSESQEAIRNLVLVVASLTMCGFTVLKPNIANVNSLFSLPTFQMPPPGAKGCTVRNLQAFQVLQSVFSKSSTPFLSSVVLDSISSVFKADHSNYFIVDSVLPQMAEKLIQKSSEVQQKYLELTEFVVFQLQFTPCKELIAISRILKNDLNENSMHENSEAVGLASLLSSHSNSNINAPEIENETRLKLMCVKMLLNLAKHNGLFKDVFREVGILEVIVTCLHRFASDMQNPDHQSDPNASLKEELGLVVIELLTLLLAGNNSNVTIFRENNGSKCTLTLITSASSLRTQALGLIQQLLMSQGGEEDMASVLVALHSSDVLTDVGLKVEILSALLICFRESHRARCNFRKAGGFLYLMSVLVSMEGLLMKSNVEPSVLKERMHLVQLIFTAFALAMRFEPANAKLFHQEICLPSLADTLRLLGCFSREKQALTSPFPTIPTPENQSDENLQIFHSIFTSSPTNIDPFSYQEKIPFSLVLSVFLFRLLYDLATDNFERSIITSTGTTIPGTFRSPRKQTSVEDGSTTGNSTPTSPAPTGLGLAAKKSVGSLNLTPPSPEPVVIHSAVVIVMVKLIPSICGDADVDETNSIMNNEKEITDSCDDVLEKYNCSSSDLMECLCQLYCSELVKSLVRNERNQQLMAQAGLTEEILERFSLSLSDEGHYLHQPIHYAFERVATHCLSAKDLRRFLRLGNPLNCERSSPPAANISAICIPVPLSRVKSLVSMTTPKSSNHHSSQSHSSFYSNSSTPFPPFVEFDMSAEGFGCLFLPSVAPHNFPTGPEFGSASLLASGIGMGERGFPGTSGMSFSSWFCVDKFSDPRSDPHPVRILTIIKEAGAVQRLCLCITVSARDKALLISTRETQLPPQGVGEWEPDIAPPHSVRVWCPELLHEGQWHHLFLVFTPSTNHPFSLYVNGRSAHTSKLDYPHRTKGAAYSAFIGTPPVWRKASRLTWRQGVSHLFEDWVPNAQTVTALWKLGPEYPGSWQAVKLQSEVAGTLISEDKIIFGLNSLAVSQLTLAKIRKIYSKSDAKAIAKQLGLSSHENATPISILHNSAAHLVGPGRSLGGVAIGYLGVRIFSPLPVSKSVLSVGGIPILIGLVAMATTGEALYAALKALVCVVKSNSVNGASSCTLVDRSCWQMLGYLLKRKKGLLSMRVLHLVFGLVCTENNIKDQRGGFGELLGDLDIWCGSTYVSTPKFDNSGASTPSELQNLNNLKKTIISDQPQDGLMKFEFNNADLEKALYEHFLQMVTEDPKCSLEILREACIVPKLLRRLAQSTVNQPSVFLLLGHLLAHKGNASSADLITYGHFIVGTLPGDYTCNGGQGAKEAVLTDMVELRNKGLQLIHSLMYTGKVINVGFCEELVARLGFDFVLLFAAPKLHPSTLLWSLRILLLLLTSSPNLKVKFRDAHTSAFCFGKTAFYQSASGARNAAAILPLKKQDSRLGQDDDSSGGTTSGGNSSGGVTVASIAGGLSGKGGIGKGTVGGWARLSWLLGQRCEDVKTDGTDIMPTEVWLILCAMVLSQPCRNISLKTADGEQMTLDAIWHYVFALPSNRMASSLYGKVTLCSDAIITLLTLIRCFITAESPTLQAGSGVNHISSTTPNNSGPNHSPQSTSASNFQSDVGSCLVQFLCYLYSHTPEFQNLFTVTEILSALAATVMPIEVKACDLCSDIGDCDEIKAFPDSEPIVVLGKHTNHKKLNMDDRNRDSIELGQEPDVFSSEMKSESPKAPMKIGEIIPNFPGTPGSTSGCINGNGENLMNHPAKKILLDFLRMIIIDWMSTSTSQTQSKTGMNMNMVIDTVLEAGGPDPDSTGLIPNNAGTGYGMGMAQYSAALVTQFHTNLLGTLLDHLIAFDLDRMTSYLQAVAHFISRLVDKLWLETFARDPQVVLDFILLLVNHCRTKRIPPTTTDMIYNSLNRVVLFVLSRRSNRWDKVEALKKLRNVRSVIFGSGNHQQEFFGCLVHVLMQLVDGLPIALESGHRTQWHVRVSPSVEDIDSTYRDKKEIRESAKLDTEISSTAERVWEDLYISKKPMVEDLFKITFPSPQPPPLSSLRDQLGDCANKLWLVYVASETSPGNKKSGNPAGLSQSWEIHQQLQSKLQKVTGGLTRLAGRSGIRKESEREKTIRDLVSQWGDAKRVITSGIKHVLSVKEILDAQDRFHLENLRHLHRFVRDTLLPQLEVELTRERGLWGPQHPSYLDKWMLDTTEGPCRMRKKLMKNDMFYVHYPYLEQLHGNSGAGGSVTSSPKARRVNPPISRDSKEFHKRFKHQPSLISDLCGTSVSSLDEAEDAALAGPSGSTSSETNLSPKATILSSTEDPFSDGSCETSDPDNQSMLFRLIGSNSEKISQIFRVAQIQGLDTAEGLLLFGKEHFYLISGFTILAKTREIKDMYYLPANMYEPILPPQCYGSGPSPAKPRSKTHTCWKFSYEDIREVHKRRYLLQPIALEIFCSDGRNYLLAYPRKVRNVVFQKFTSVSKNLSDSGTDAKQSVAGQRRSTSVEQSAGLFSSLIGDTTVTQRWVRGDISNFQYLMHLNTLAGRSYNDLMQYPVFPWILADYDSHYLDLNDSTTFRDLSKPMGAQSAGRLVQFVKRFKEWDDPHGETPPYHYGTHYSSAMIVCSYLVRMEPFAQHFLRLQGGHFDLADRMFHSIKEAWTSASKHNMADVKELIPEFFYLPEFLSNGNNFDLGSKQNGVSLGDVILPPWAKGDPREFIRVHRMALESDYVSQHLHEWIDLVFGYKQQGPPAVESVNVFHHLFYEGNVDIYTIDDPLKKNATIGFINNFGQIPKQLFKKQHPVKRVNLGGSTSGSGIGMMKPYNLGILETPNPLMALAATAGSNSSQYPTEKVYFHHVDNLRPTMTPIKELKGPIGQIMSLDRANCIIAVEQNKFLLSPARFISWGFADCSVRVCHVDTDRPIFIWEHTQQHMWMGNMGEIVTCTAASDKVAITGSTNTVVSVWDVVDRELRLKAHLFGHTEPITCLTCSPSYNIIVSGSKDLTCIVWDLARLSFVRQLVPHSAPIDAVGVNELTGDIATCDGSWLRLWSINGDALGRVDTAGVGGGGGMSQGVLCVSFSYLNEWDCDNVVMTGSTDGIVRMWSIRYVQLHENEAIANEANPGFLPINQSMSDDSSIASGSESEPEVVEEPIVVEENGVLKTTVEEIEEPEMELLTAEVFDPDKDRDSLEDIQEAVVTTSDIDSESVTLRETEILPVDGNIIENHADKMKAVMRRQRALSSGTSSDRDSQKRSASSTSSISVAAAAAEARKAKRKSDIPTKGDGRSSAIRGSKSETSLSFDADESFEVLTDAEVATIRQEERKMSHGSALLAAHQLKEGHVWRRRIVFRGKLTMHTAYDRKDNTEPASITAISVSRDHKNVYVGDARGRVFSWAVSESSAGRADHWVRDEVSDSCAACQTKFTLTERKHHCRNCGQLFCSKCSRFESEIFRLRILRPVRVCQPCFVQLKGRMTSLPSTSSDT